MKNESGISKGIFGLLILAIAAIAVGWLLQGDNSSTLLGAASGKTVAPKRQIKIAALKDLDPNGPRMFQIGVEPIMALIDELEARGSKVEMTEIENSGLSNLNIKIDGRELTPVLTECKQCEPIVFEY